MSENFFHDLKAGTDTRFWINNPSAEELEYAHEQGAVSCTTNPAYCSKLMVSEPDYLAELIDDVLSDEKDEQRAAEEVYRRASQRIMDSYIDVYRKSGGREGFVTIQDDPRKDFDAAHTMNAVQRNLKLGDNYMAKIPVVAGGIEAVSQCIAMDIPVCATEIFSISQAEHICDIYERASRQSGNTPVMYVTHISGIFDEYLGKVADREGIAIDDEVLHSAGLAVARRQYAKMKARGCNLPLLGGGARADYHFTGLLGGDAHITINWSTAASIMQSAAEADTRDILQETPRRVIDELREKFVDFRKAYDDDGLAVEEFAEYGPVQLFRNAFLKGWYQLLAEVVSHKHRKAL